MEYTNPARLRTIIIGTLIGLALLLTFLDNTGNLDPVLAFVRDPAATLLRWTSGRAANLAEVVDGPRSLAEARQQIAALEEQIDLLEKENESLREAEGDLQNLLDLVNRARQTPEISRITAEVIGYDPSPAILSLIIDKGSDDGVVVGMPVESARGLVGRVFRTTPSASQVALLTDNASSIAVRLGNSRATGLMQGGGLGGETVIDWIDQGYSLSRGEVVLTSGLSGDFPEGLIVGRVSEVRKSEAELFQQALVQPAVDFDSLEIVFVITGFQPVDLDIFSDPPGG